MRNKAKSLINTLVSGANVDAQKVAVKYGYRPRNNQELTKALHLILLEYGDKAMSDFAAIHPDRTLIESLRRDEFNRSWGADGKAEGEQRLPVEEKKKPIIDQDTVHLILVVVGIWGAIKLFTDKKG